jgi:hypothetical protein
MLARLRAWSFIVRQLIQLRLRPSAGENFRRQVPAFADGFYFPGHKQRRARVQQNRIALWSRVLIAQQAADDFRIHATRFFRRSRPSSGQVSEHGGLNREMAGRNDGISKAALLVKFSDHVIAERRKLVQPRISDLAADDHGAAHAEGLENARQHGTKLRTRHAHKLRGGPRGVEQRAEEVEERALPALGANFARGADVPEGGMIEGRKKKGEMMLAQGTGGGFGRQINFDAERLQNVRTPGLRSDGAIAMLGDRYSGGSANQGDCCRNVESIQAVSAGAANVKDLARARFGVERRNDGFGAQFTGEGGDFRRRLVFAGERAEKVGFEFRGDRLVYETMDRGGDLFIAKWRGLC